MKISIITAVLNRERTILDALESVQSQRYQFVEHLLVDGISSDKTLEIIEGNMKSNTILISELDRGIYDAINKGIHQSTGEVIGLLHSDDVFYDKYVLQDVAKAFADPMVDAVYGDLEYVSKFSLQKVIRYWKSGVFSKRNLLWGWMPPHPTLFLRRRVFENLGVYDINYKISADYDATLRYFFGGNIVASYIPRVFVRMRLGGESNKSFSHICLKMKEDYKAIRSNKVGGLGCLIFKNLAKVPQFFFHKRDI